MPAMVDNGGVKVYRTHNIFFSPISVFVEFVKGQAKARNGPSFVTNFNTMTLLHANQTSFPKEHGREQANTKNLDVTATCTEVCGNVITGKSCSKIYLVQVYPNEQRDNIKKMYTITD